jgi:hypothetical protein
MSSDPVFDHIAKADSQTVHCERAAFFALGGIPTSMSERIQLGLHIGFGLVCGGTCAAGVIALVSKALKALFA